MNTDILKTVKTIAVILGAVVSLAKTAADLVGEVVQTVESDG